MFHNYVIYTLMHVVFLPKTVLAIVSCEYNRSEVCVLCVGEICVLSNSEGPVCLWMNIPGSTFSGFLMRIE